MSIKKDELLELIRAGYTKAEIEALTKDEVKDEIKEDKPEIKEVKDEVKDEIKEERKDNDPNPDDLTQMIKALSEGFSNLNKTIQASNLVRDEFKEKSALEMGQEVVANIINPPTNKKK